MGKPQYSWTSAYQPTSEWHRNAVFFCQTSSNVIPNHFFGPMLLIVGAQLRVQSPPRCDWPTGSHTLAAAPEDWSDFTCAQFRSSDGTPGLVAEKAGKVSTKMRMWRTGEMLMFRKIWAGDRTTFIPHPKRVQQLLVYNRKRHLEHTPLLAGPDTCDARSPRMPDECWPLHGLKVGAFHLQQEQSITAGGSPVIQSRFTHPGLASLLGWSTQDGVPLNTHSYIAVRDWIV